MTAPVPAWREHAAPGQSLAALRAAQKPVPEKVAPSGMLSRDLSKILRPQAAYRWLLPQLAAITPQYIELTLRGALAGNHVQSWELFDLMEDTWPRLNKNANQLKLEVVQEVRGWKARPYEEEDEPASDLAKERARLVNAAMFGMRPSAPADENDFGGTVYDIMDAWLKGQSVIETDWEVRSAGKLGDIVAPRATFWVHPTCVAWSMDGTLGLRLELAQGSATLTPGVWTGTSYQPMPSKVAPFPDDKFLVSICKAKSGTALGAARLRSLAWWWCAMNFSADWLLNLAQLWSLPFRWANYDPNAPQQTIDAICGMLENMGSNAWAAFPAGTTMELEYPNGSGSGGSGPSDNIIDRADKNCDLIVLGQTLTSDVSKEGGSRSQGEVHERVEEKIMQAACGFVASVLNTQLITSILRLNYGEDADTERPEFRGEDEEPGTLDFKRSVLTQWSQHAVVSAVLANLTDLKQLVRDSGMPVNEEYQDPYVPVKDLQGNAVTGELVKDPEGDVIGAGTEKPSSAEPGNAEGGVRNAEFGKEKKDGAGDLPEAKAAKDAPLKASTPTALDIPALEESGTDHYAAALASDLEHVRVLIAGLAEIQDDRILAQRALEVRDQIEQLKADILKLPKSARALADVQVAAFFNGLTEKSGNRKIAKAENK